MKAKNIESKVELAEIGIEIKIQTNTYRQCPTPFSNYAASASGEIVGRRGTVLSTLISSSGYEMVSVQKDNGKMSTTTVHHLVALAWIPNPKHLSDVDHKDNNKLNNAVSNLQWLSHRDNLAKRPVFRNRHQVFKVTRGKIICSYPSISSASRSNDLSFTSVRGSCNGTLHLNRPYYFEFAQEAK
ncbi:HNH endonuclease [Schleiferilactobacillus harbinensis]|uniref:HNH endonuclease n=1 Tax=Schleiferilactobacillus harbinensis TaxID=304207 RepID=UPI0039ED919D